MMATRQQKSAGEVHHQADDRNHRRLAERNGRWLEQAQHRFVRQHAVDDHHAGGRDEEAQRAGTGQAADGDALVIAALAQLIERDDRYGAGGARSPAPGRARAAAPPRARGR